MKIFTLIYAERTHCSPASGSIVGPVLSTTRGELIDLVFSYVSNRILADPDDFCEEFLVDENAVQSPADLDLLLQRFSAEERERAANWYVEWMRHDDELEVFYRIEEHDVAPTTNATEPPLRIEAC